MLCINCQHLLILYNPVVVYTTFLHYSFLSYKTRGKPWLPIYILKFSSLWNFDKYQNFEFQLSKTNCSRVTEKGNRNTFELYHTHLDCKNTYRIWILILILDFSFLGPTVQELQKKGMVALLNYRVTFKEWPPLTYYSILEGSLFFKSL